MATIDGRDQIVVINETPRESNRLMLLDASQHRRDVYPVLVSDRSNRHQTTAIINDGNVATIDPRVHYVTDHRPQRVSYVMEAARSHRETNVVTVPAVQQPPTVIYPSTPAVDPRFMYRPAPLRRKHNVDYQVRSRSSSSSYLQGLVDGI